MRVDHGTGAIISIDNGHLIGKIYCEGYRGMQFWLGDWPYLTISDNERNDAAVISPNP